MVWDYASREPFAYGDETTYRLGMEMLADCELVEDWGCGTAWAKRYCAGDYVGVDQAPGYADVVADLRDYMSFVPGIFMRHVLEHNHDWTDILDNAVSSATQTLVVILFTPLGPETRVEKVSQGIPDISFKALDIEERFGDHHIYSRDLVTETEYGCERIYCVDMSKPKAPAPFVARLQA